MGGKKGRGNKRKCQDCGEFNELQAAYCGQCGAALVEREKGNQGSGKREPPYRIIVAIIALVFVAGFLLKMVISFSSRTHNGDGVYQESSLGVGPIENQVQLVASNFKCACGGCGELPLIECDCDMPRGALEEKAFIREKLMEGYPADQVIQWVEDKYGLRITG
jgi:hypothetical protein